MMKRLDFKHMNEDWNRKLSYCCVYSNDLFLNKSVKKICQILCNSYPKTSQSIILIICACFQALGARARDLTKQKEEEGGN